MCKIAKNSQSTQANTYKFLYLRQKCRSHHPISKILHTDSTLSFTYF